MCSSVSGLVWSLQPRWYNAIAWLRPGEACVINNQYTLVIRMEWRTMDKLSLIYTEQEINKYSWNQLWQFAISCRQLILCFSHNLISRCYLKSVNRLKLVDTETGWSKLPPLTAHFVHFLTECFFNVKCLALGFQQK